MLQRMKSKKGFTLAELLIVVAIIAVLTAIAVPLFVKGIQDAKEATFNANVRAIRGAAVAEILMADEKSDLYFDKVFGTGEEVKTEVYVEAVVSESGNISGLKISKQTTETTWETFKDKKYGTDPIVVKITKTDLAKADA